MSLNNDRDALLGFIKFSWFVIISQAAFLNGPQLSPTGAQPGPNFA